jgi:hypothetical protein
VLLQKHKEEEKEEQTQSCHVHTINPSWLYTTTSLSAHASSIELVYFHAIPMPGGCRVASGVAWIPCVTVQHGGTVGLVAVLHQLTLCSVCHLLQNSSTTTRNSKSTYIIQQQD